MAVVIRFDKKLYGRASVEEAINDWREVGTFELAEEDASFQVTVASLADPDMTLEGDAGQTIAGEFSNYVLGLETVARR